MPEYQDAPEILPEGNVYAGTIVIAVDPAAGGRVELQIQNADGEWQIGAGDGYMITTFGSFDVKRRNQPETRIFATGGAKFYVIGA